MELFYNLFYIRQVKMKTRALQLEVGCDLPVWLLRRIRFPSLPFAQQLPPQTTLCPPGKTKPRFHFSSGSVGIKEQIVGNTWSSIVCSQRTAIEVVMVMMSIVSDFIHNTE